MKHIEFCPFCERKDKKVLFEGGLHLACCRSNPTRYAPHNRTIQVLRHFARYANLVDSVGERVYNSNSCGNGKFLDAHFRGSIAVNGSRRDFNLGVDVSFVDPFAKSYYENLSPDLWSLPACVKKKSVRFSDTIVSFLEFCSEMSVDLGAPVAPLLKQHEESISSLLTSLSDEIEAAGDVSTPVDDLYALRYLLSSEGDLTKARESMAKGIKWRSDNIQILNSKAKGEIHHSQAIFDRFQIKGWCGAIGAEKHPLFIVRTSLCDVKTVMNSLTEDEVVQCLLFNSEIGFQLSDKRSRESGKLVKVISVIDMNYFSLFSTPFDKRFISALGKSSHLSSDYYPQLLGRSVMINVPTALRYAIKALNLVQSKKTVDKQSICPAQHSDKKSALECPFLQKFGGVESIPTFLGGHQENFDHNLLPIPERPDVQSFQIKPKSSETLEMNVENDLNIEVYVEIVIQGGKFEIDLNFEGAVLNHVVVQKKDGLYSWRWNPEHQGVLKVKVANVTKSSHEVQVRLLNRPIQNSGGI